MSALRELFGGAIVMNVPKFFLDASDLRQVPDTQEVFLDPNSNFSLIVDILQRVDADEDERAVKLHFDCLAEDNSAHSQQIIGITVPSTPQPECPPESPFPIILQGEQTIQKFNQKFNHKDDDRICILLALYRIKAKKVDILLTANIPLSISPSSSQPDDLAVRLAKGIFKAASQSLKVVDFELFA
ncbi:Mog1p/PsbP-like protein [Hysterangium stoloniferum]|nr:Mog1p/PsbP-like protein [Hysterangium stoloniferum]